MYMQTNDTLKQSIKLLNKNKYFLATLRDDLAKIATCYFKILGLTVGIYGMRQWLRQPLPVLGYTEQSATLADTKFTGKLQPAKTFKIAAINPGVVENIEVQVGDKVEVGQPLLTLKNLAAVDQKKQIVQEKQLTKQQQQEVLRILYPELKPFTNAQTLASIVFKVCITKERSHKNS